MLSGCCVHCQQPVKMLRLKSGTPSLRERERERESVCVCVRLYMCSSLCEKTLEWVLCCLDVTSIVNSLSRCSVLSQVPRVYKRERERERERVCVCVRLYMCSSFCEKAFEWVLCCLDVASVVNSLSRCSVLSQVPRVYERERERESVCVYVCMCVAVCVRKPWSGSCVVWMLRSLSTACQDALS